MLKQIKGRLIQNQGEWQSKLTDGVLLSVILILLWLTFSLTLRPLHILLGMPGLLVFVLGLMAVSMYTLQQAIVSRRLDAYRAWLGITGGFLCWLVVLITGQMGVPIFPNLASVLLLVMVGLIVAILWRSVLPLGVRFFFLTFLMNWAGYLFAGVQEQLSSLSPVFTLAQFVLGGLFAFAALVVLGWILFQTRRRLQRVSGGLALWFLISMLIYSFQGNIF